MISENLAADLFTGRGGGVHCAGDDAMLINTVVSKNVAVGDGGGLWLSGEDVAIVNCTFSDNVAVFFGGAVAYDEGSTGILRNSVLWNDSAGLGAELALLNGSELRLAHSDVENGELEAFVDEGANLAWGLGNIDADPLFVDSTNDDYRLSGGSPCIDAADNFAVPNDFADQDGDGDTDERLPFDLDGNPRVVDDPVTEDTGLGTPPIVDMGAYEFQIPADLNGDGCVDQADLGILLADWGCTGADCSGDCDFDGDTDQADLGILLAYWGEGCGD